MGQEILQARDRLQTWVRAKNYAGTDPYDILRSPFPFQRLGKWPPILATQFQKRSPIDLRPLLSIQPTRDPKAIALLLEASCVKAKSSHAEEDQQEAEQLFRILMKLRSDLERMDAWGYPFPWHTPERSLPSFAPTIVVTGTVARAVHCYYRFSGSNEALQSLKRISPFILEGLFLTEDETGICFSYSQARKDRCYNASLLGAEHLARMHALTGDEEARRKALRASEFVLARQHADGRWNYSEDPESGKERTQIDHHQGFVIDSLRRIHHYAAPDDESLLDAVRKGLAFYRNEQFFDSGRSMWRIPKKWPVDIHSQAQGIVSFSLNKDLDPSYANFAERIAGWTIANMQGQDGSFYYRITPLFKNRIRYMRWGQAWMLLALNLLLEKEANRSV